MADDLVPVPRHVLERCRALVEAVQLAEAIDGSLESKIVGGHPIPTRSVRLVGRAARRAHDEADALLLSDLDAALQP